MSVHIYKLHEQEDGSLKIMQYRKDGIVREVSPVYGDYLEYINEGNTADKIDYIAPEALIQIEPQPVYEPTYADLRRREYPLIGDQLDAILKMFNIMKLQGTNLVSQLDEIIGEWLAVKRKYPKPEGEDE